MDTKERFTRMFRHSRADRIPIADSPWDTTLARWRKEGLPPDMDWVDFFEVDKVITIEVDNSPRYEEKVLEDTDRYQISTTNWGVTRKKWKHATSTPEYLGYTIKDRETWYKAKKRIDTSEDRIPWDFLEKNYDSWRERGYWIEGMLWFGFDVTHSSVLGTEKTLVSLARDPQWIMDIFHTQISVNTELMDMIWEAGYRFDAVRWPDDMGYKNNQFFSLKMYRDILKPFHKQAVEYAHKKGVWAVLHSCGNINPFVPELVEIGLDGLNPIEVKAGMDPIMLKKRFGDKLTLHGGINAVLWDKPEKIEEEIRQVVPTLKEGGGYIFASDHSIPDSVSLKDFSRIVELVKEVGSYSS